MTTRLTRRDIYLSAIAMTAASLFTRSALADRPDDGVTLLDIDWTITRIGQTETLDGFPHPTMRFSLDGTFSGKACNMFTGRYVLDGASLSLGPAAATRMACAEPLMRQENELFSVFEKINSYELTADGSLHLKDTSEATLIIARQ
jgi:heat shock protein HslJ